MIGSSGSGKTALAGQLAAMLDCPHIELDAMFHQPNWTSLETEEFRHRVRQATASERWVVDGNYTAVRDLVWERADTVLCLDFPLTLVLERLVRRTVRRTVKRTELWNGNREQISHVFSLDPQKSIIVWSLSRHALYHRRFEAARVDPQWSALTFIQLRSPTQVAQLLKNAERFMQKEGVS